MQPDEVKPRQRAEWADTTPLSSLGLPVRVHNALMQAGVETLGELQRAVAASLLPRIRNMGVMGERIVLNKLASLGWSPPAPGIEDRGPVASSSPVSMLRLPVRVYNALMRAGIRTVGELQQAAAVSSLPAIHNIGVLGEEVILHELASLGLPPPVAGVDNARPVALSTLVPTSGVHTEVEKDEARRAGSSRPAHLPVAILFSRLSKETVAILRETHVRTLDELSLALSRGSSQLPSRLGEQQTALVGASLRALEREEYAPFIDEHRRELSRRIESGRLDPHLIFYGVRLRELTELEACDVPADPLSLLVRIAAATEHISVADDLTVLLGGLTSRELEILLQRSSVQRPTLQELADKEKLTRERIRQIEAKARRRLAASAASAPLLYVRSAISVAQELRSSLSMDTWRKELDRRGTLGKWPPALDGKAGQHGDVFALLVEVLLMLGKAKGEVCPFKIPGEVMLLPKIGGLTIGQSKGIREIPRVQLKALRRQAVFTCGISLAQAEDDLGVARDVAAAALEGLALVYVEDGWYAVGYADQVKKWPPKHAGLKMLQACGPLELDLFCGGLRRHISRHYPGLAPPAVVWHVLPMLGFDCRGGVVGGPVPQEDVLSSSEKTFLGLTAATGPIVSLYEVAEAFQRAGRSLPGASGVLRHSPIVEKVEPGFYKLRGRNVTWSDISVAQQRQLTVERDASLDYGVDGKIRYRVTLAPYEALSGVLSATRLPDLGGGWSVMAEGRAYGSARADGIFVWGLRDAIKSLPAAAGERVKLTFDTRARTVDVSKVDNGQDA